MVARHVELLDVKLDENAPGGYDVLPRMPIRSDVQPIRCGISLSKSWYSLSTTADSPDTE
eukprot:15163993-Alexandrium_andersonii.AAC.1